MGFFSPMTIIDNEFPILIAGKQNILSLSTRNRIKIAILRRIIRIVHAKELVFSFPSRRWNSHGGLVRLSGGRPKGICRFQLHSFIIQQQLYRQIALQMATSSGRVSSHFPEKERVDVGYDQSPLLYDQLSRQSYRPDFRGAFARVFKLDSKWDNPDHPRESPNRNYSAIREDGRAISPAKIAYSIFPAISTEGKRGSFGQTMLSAWNDKKMSTGRLSSGLRTDVPATQLISFFAYQKNMIGREPRLKLDNQGFRSRGSSLDTHQSQYRNAQIITACFRAGFAGQHNIISKDKLISISGASGSFMPIISLSRYHEDALMDSHSMGERMGGSSHQWISGSPFSDHFRGRFPYLFFPIQESNFRASLQAYNSPRGRIEKEHHYPYGSIAADSLIDRYSPEARMDGSGHQWISGRTSSDHFKGRFPDLIFSIQEGNIKSSLQKDIRTGIEIEKKVYKSDGSRTEDRSHGFDKISTQRAEMSRPEIDLAQIADHIYAMLEKKIKVERERRGYYGL
jgi:hypothetical protein